MAHLQVKIASAHRQPHHIHVQKGRHQQQVPRHITPTITTTATPLKLLFYPVKHLSFSKIHKDIWRKLEVVNQAVDVSNTYEGM